MYHIEQATAPELTPHDLLKDRFDALVALSRSYTDGTNIVDLVKDSDEGYYGQFTRIHFVNREQRNVPIDAPDIEITTKWPGTKTLPPTEQFAASFRYVDGKFQGAHVAVVNNQVYGELSEETVKQLIEEYDPAKWQVREPRRATQIGLFARRNGPLAVKFAQESAPKVAAYAKQRALSKLATFHVWDQNRERRTDV